MRLMLIEPRIRFHFSLPLFAVLNHDPDLCAFNAAKRAVKVFLFPPASQVRRSCVTLRWSSSAASSLFSACPSSLLAKAKATAVSSCYGSVVRTDLWPAVCCHQVVGASWTTGDGGKRKGPVREWLNLGALLATVALFVDAFKFKTVDHCNLRD